MSGKRVIIDTRDATSLYLSEDKSTVHFRLPESINAKSIDIISCEIPLSFYNVNDNNNCFNINGDDVFFNVGNYNAYDLAIQLTNLINNKTKPTLVNVVYNINILKFQIILNTSLIGTSTYTINFSTSYNLTGFTSPITLSSAQAIYIAPAVANMNSISSIYVQSNISENANFFYNNTYGNSLYRIPITSYQYGSIITLNNSNSLFKSYCNKIIDYIEISLIDQDGYKLNLNQADWVLEMYVNY